MHILKNDRLYIEIADRGAEMRRATLDGKDVLWSGDPTVWPGVSPLLFPMCGGTKADEYTYKGNTYHMEKHGFIRALDFELEQSGENFLTFKHEATPATFEKFPFHYTLRVTYRLSGTSLAITYNVYNGSNEPMPFTIGSHEGYACPEGIEEYDVIFEKEETLAAYELEGNLLRRTTTPILHNSRVFPLYERYFAVDALVFKDLKSRAATLRHRPSGRQVTVQFPGCDYFLLWQKHRAPYICMEPWVSVPTFVDEEQNLETREGTITVAPNDTWEQTHSILF